MENTAPNPTTSLANTDPQGRFDVMLYRLAQMFTTRVIEPRVNNLPLFANGLGDVIEHAIRRNLPSKKFTPVDVATALGMFPPAPAARKNPGRKRGRR